MLIWALAGCVVGFDQHVTIDEPIDRIVVDVTAGNLSVRAQEGPIVVSGEFGGPGGGPVTGEVNGTELTMTYTCNLCGGELVITAPPDTALDLVLGAGDLDVADMSGELVASLLGGTATVLRHGPSPVAMTVDVGALRASFLEPPPSVAATVTTGGGIDVAVPAGPYALQLEASGDLVVDPAITDDPTSPHEVTLTAVAGSITLAAE